MGGGIFLLLMVTSAPMLLGLLVSRGAHGGAIINAFKAYGLWLGLLVSGFLLVTGFNTSQALIGSMIYGMFFSIVTVALIAVVMRLWTWWQHRVV